MPNAPKDDRPPQVVAMQWVNQIVTIGLEMVLPAVLGHWLDQRWKTEPWLVATGAILGFVVAMAHLLSMTRTKRRSSPNDVRKNGGKTTDGKS